MHVTIRRASAADADLLSCLNADVQALHADAMPWRFKPPSPAGFAAAAAELIARPDAIILIAELHGEPAGYAYAQVFRNTETPSHFAYDMVYLHHISVRPDFRKKGAGTALLQAVRSAGQELGVGLVALDVWSFNEPARRFFRRHGFTTYNERLWNRSAG
jgi:ribosomal protein S18 acetylase RimI-like enzyme